MSRPYSSTGSMPPSWTLWSLPRTDSSIPESSICLLSAQKLLPRNKFIQKNEIMQKQWKAVKNN